MKTTPAKKPHGYRNTNLYFKTKKQAEDYVKFVKEQFLKNKAKKLEYPDISKKKKKKLKHSKPKKYLLTKENKGLLLWEKMS